MWNNIQISDYIGSDSVKGYRTVEDQNLSYTRNLVADNDEHVVLEEMLEESKPPKPLDCKIDDYLLFTPFRYPPLLAGTRFGTVTERSLFYGSLEIKTSLAEKAFSELKFFNDTTIDIPLITNKCTSFVFNAETDNALDLAKPPFTDFSNELTDKVNYSSTQRLGTEMRNSEIDMFRFNSVRVKGGTNIGIFTPKVFSKAPEQKLYEHWTCYCEKEKVSFMQNREIKFEFKKTQIC